MIRFSLALILLVLTHSSRAQGFSFDLESGYQGWTADFADYPAEDSVNWNLGHTHQLMPGITPAQSGLRLTGDNFSDDLFFFVKQQFTGFLPNTTYQVVFSIDVVTDMPEDGIGGSDLTLKAGVTRQEPRKVITRVDDRDFYVMNIDKGNQSVPGADMDTFGRVAHPVLGSFTYQLVNFSNETFPFSFTTDSSGTAWVIVGAESAFENPNSEFLIAGIGFTFTATTPTERLRPVEVLSRFPNPGAKEGTRVVWPEKGKTARLIAADGRILAVWDRKDHPEIRIQGLQAGMYCLQVMDAQGLPVATGRYLQR